MALRNFIIYVVSFNQHYHKNSECFVNTDSMLPPHSHSLSPTLTLDITDLFCIYNFVIYRIFRKTESFSMYPLEVDFWPCEIMGSRYIGLRPQILAQSFWNPCKFLLGKNTRNISCSIKGTLGGLLDVGWSPKRPSHHEKHGSFIPTLHPPDR